MADLVAVGYPDEVTAEAAADEVRRPAVDLTTHHAVGGGAVWGMVWGSCSACCSSSRSSGRPWAPGLGTLMGKSAKSSTDKQFQAQVRGMLQPGTSALVLMLKKVTPDKAVEAMSKCAARPRRRPCPRTPEKELQDALHGGETVAH